MFNVHATSCKMGHNITCLHVTRLLVGGGEPHCGPLRYRVRRLEHGRLETGALREDPDWWVVAMLSRLCYRVLSSEVGSGTAGQVLEILTWKGIEISDPNMKFVWARSGIRHRFPIQILDVECTVLDGKKLFKGTVARELFLNWDCGVIG